jgi:hypothetical protein
MRERDIERYLVTRAKALGGEVRKVKWLGRNGAPDRIIMHPRATLWVELKATGKTCPPHQRREHERMRRMGQLVAVIDACQAVEDAFAAYGLLP